jgi:tripeptide aminopeptidase
LGITPKLEKIRGGTDGSQFTAQGLPTPNLSAGQHNIHSPLEFACLEEMAQAREIGLQLVRLWSREPKCHN